MAFQMRATAFLRSVNFFTEMSPGRLFQISIRRPRGQALAKIASSFQAKSLFAQHQFERRPACLPTTLRRP